MVTRYALYADGEEICLIDRLAGIVRIMGKDYAQDLHHAVNTETPSEMAGFYHERMKYMKGTIKLKTPITVNGQQVAELTYDTEEITADLFSAADAHRRLRQARGT